MDVHVFDNKIKTELAPLIDVDITEKKDRCRELLKLQLEPHVLSILKIIIDDIGTDKNFDKSNGLCADDLLYRCVDYINNPDFIKIFKEQIGDMRTGMCQQGRTHRLYQSLLAFTD